MAAAIVLLTTIVTIIFYAQKSSALTNTRHVMDDDNDLYLLLPFPIDVCFTAKRSDSNEQYIRYECSTDGTKVYRKVWDTSSSITDCYTDTNATTTDTFDASTSTPCHRGAFECNGNDNYVTHDVWLRPPTAQTCDGPPLLTIPTAVGCFCTNTTSIEVSCTNAYNGQFIKYSDTSCNNITSAQSITNCSTIFTLELGITYNIISEISTCTINGTVINKTLSPTPQTIAPTTATPTEQTPSPITFGSRFIMDNDWLFGDNLPFPMDKCLQTQPFLGTATTDVRPEFVYYKCNSAKDQVTKYKWTNVLDFESFDCNTTSTATISIVTADTHHNDICQPYYFNCDGNDDYVTTLYQASTGYDCVSGIDLFTISMVTDACYCGDTLLQTSHQLQCSQTESMVYEFEGTTSCVNTTDPDPRVNVTGKNNECALWKSAVISNTTYNIFRTMKECVQDNVELFTLAPTLVPTTETSAPSASPTRLTGSPTLQPTSSPLLPGQTVPPTDAPITPVPTVSPITTEPTDAPTDATQAPIQASTGLTFPPTDMPIADPTDSPTQEVFTSTDNGGRQNVDNDKKEMETWVIIVIVAAVVLCCCIVVIILWLKMKNKEKSDESDEELPNATELQTVRSKDTYDENENESNEEEADDPIQAEEDDAIEDTEKIGLKTGRRRKRKPKRRRKRKKEKKENSSDEDVLDEDEKKHLELVTAGAPSNKGSDTETQSKLSNLESSDANYDDEEKEAEYVTPGGPDKDSSTDTDTD
eukprot:212222_1